MREYTQEGLRLIGCDRLCLIADFYCWQDYLIQGNFSFSLGQRIHGNIMSLLAGIPCYVLWHDTRTKEMVDYFHLPGKMYRKNEKIDPYELFCEVDYDEFNKNYTELFGIFENHLKKYGLIKNEIDIQKDPRLLEYNDFSEYTNKDILSSIKKCQYLDKRYCVANDVVESYWEAYDCLRIKLSSLKHMIGGLSS